MQCHERLTDYIPTCLQGITWLLANKTKLYSYFIKITNISTNVHIPINAQKHSSQNEHD